MLEIVSEYDQEIPHSQTADNPVAPRGRAAKPSRDTRKTNYLFLRNLKFKTLKGNLDST